MLLLLTGCSCSSRIVPYCVARSRGLPVSFTWSNTDTEMLTISLARRYCHFGSISLFLSCTPFTFPALERISNIYRRVRNSSGESSHGTHDTTEAIIVEKEIDDRMITIHSLNMSINITVITYVQSYMALFRANTKQYQTSSWYIWTKIKWFCAGRS